MKQKLLIVDGMALLFRSFYATAIHGRYMINKHGIPTNGVHGLIRHLLAAIKHFSPHYVVCCWDLGAKTYRTELFDQYKANRSEPPQELIPQFDLAKQALNDIKILNIGVPMYEADDCIGTIAEKVKDELEVMILTGDRDLLQLLDKHVHVAFLKKGIGNYSIYSKERFIEEYQIQPKQLIDVKALMGDSSDNYPGVKGIGEKTAFKLIVQYQSIEQLLKCIDELTNAQKRKIKEDIEILKLSRKLAEINVNVPLEFEISEAKLNLTIEKIEEMKNKYDIGLSTSTFIFLDEAVS